MRIKKIYVITLTVLLVLSFTGCSNSSKKYEKVFKDLGYEELEEYDVSDVAESMEDGIYYSTRDKKEIKRLGKRIPISNVKAENVSSIFFGGIYDDDGQFVVYSVTFKNKKDAQKSYDKKVRELEKIYDNYKETYDDLGFEYDCDDGDDFYSVASFAYNGQYFEVIQDDTKTVTYIFADFFYSEDSYDDYLEFYNLIGRDCPSELLKSEVESR